MKRASFLTAMALFCVTAPMRAQGGTVHSGSGNGCTHSPENCTAVLAVVGSAGTFFGSMRNRLKARASAR